MTSLMDHPRHSALKASSSMPALGVHGLSAVAHDGDGKPDAMKTDGARWPFARQSRANSYAAQVPMECAKSAQGASPLKRPFSQTAKHSAAISLADPRQSSRMRVSRPGGCAAQTSTLADLAHFMSALSRRPFAPPNSVLSAPVYTFSADPELGNVTRRRRASLPASVCLSCGNHLSMIESCRVLSRTLRSSTHKLALGRVATVAGGGLAAETSQGGNLVEGEFPDPSLSRVDFYYTK